MDWKRGKRRMTSFSLPLIGGGAGWQYGTGERDAVERAVILLTERRALSAGYEWEDEDYLNAGVILARSALTECLQALEYGSHAYRLIERLRDACNEFLTAVGRPRQGVQGLRPHVQDALGTLRESFRVTLAYIAKHGDLQVAAQLAACIPQQMSPDGPLGPRIGSGFVAPPPDLPFNNPSSR